MRVFLTGATGFIGSAVLRELLAAGHQVLGLARSDASARAIAAAGADAHRGDLADGESLASGARGCEGVIHTAFIHDFSRFKAVCELDRQAIAALGGALAGTSRPLVVTSGAALVAPGRLATEEDTASGGAESHPRIASEEAALAAAARGARQSVVRLAVVHGPGDPHFLPSLIAIAREKRVSAYIGEGRNRWPAVHRLDAARLYRLVLEQGAVGGRYHGVAEEGVVFRDIAEVIGRRLGIPVAAVPPEAAAGHFGWLAAFAAMDGPTSSRLTRERLGWQPAQPSLLADLDGESYFP